MSVQPLPLFLVCEDGDEYTQRFQRFLGHDFRFLRVPNGQQAEAAIERNRPVGLLVDLDFGRLPPSDLLGEHGHPSQSPTAEQRTRWSASQGILILQYVRLRDLRVPALLFADLDDREQAAYLERTLAPLAIVSSREGLRQLAKRLRAMASGGSATAGGRLVPPTAAGR